MVQKIKIQRLSSNPEISHRILLQFCELKDAINIDESQKKKLLSSVLEVIKKLESVSYHRDNLNRIINKELSARDEEQKKGNAIIIDYSTGTERELEALLFQGKATLDVLVKILMPLIGIHLQTYGDSGKRVLKSLRNNLPAENLQQASWLIGLIENAVPWTKQWVGPYRDTVAHYRSFESSGFVGIPDDAGNMKYFPPVDKRGMPIHKLADRLFLDLMSFCEAFLVFSYRIKIFKRLDIKISSVEERTKDSPSKYVLCMVCG